MTAFFGYLLRKSLRDRSLAALCATPAFIIASAMVSLAAVAAFERRPVFPVRMATLTNAQTLTAFSIATVWLATLTACTAGFLTLRRDVAQHGLPLWVLASKNCLLLCGPAMLFGAGVGLIGHAMSLPLLASFGSLQSDVLFELVTRMTFCSIVGSACGVVFSLVAPNGGGLTNALIVSAIASPLLLLISTLTAAVVTVAVMLASLSGASELMVRRSAA